MIRVGFFMQQTDKNWLGGINYLSNLLKAILLDPDRKINPVLFVPPETPESIISEFPKIEIIRTRLASKKSTFFLVRRILLLSLGHDFLLEKILKKYSIDVLSHSDAIGIRSEIPTIGWLPDFQHLRLKNLFSNQELWKRNQAFRRIINSCTTILLSSYSAKKDLDFFFSYSREKAQVLQFVSGLDDKTDISQEEIMEKYGINSPYFHLPNQFWIHKNHELVVKSLQILKNEKDIPLIISTGHTIDHRNPEFFDHLMQTVKEAGVQDSFRVLGTIPYPDLCAMMRHSIAVINPSHFEGWSTSVEEGKSLGKKILLSDISVHREQAPERSTYFNPNGAEELAEAMKDAIATYSPGDEEIFRSNASKKRLNRLIDFAKRYEAIVLEAIKRS